MIDKKLHIHIPFGQILCIVFEFPLVVLGQYHGISNLDEIWDDTIMPIINASLLESGAYLQRSEVAVVPMRRGNDQKLSYRVLVNTNLPAIDLTRSIERLTEANLQKGLCIKRISSEVSTEILYADAHYLEK